MIIITSSLGSLLSGGVNAQRVQALLRDMERYCPLRQRSVHGLSLMGQQLWFVGRIFPNAAVVFNPFGVVVFTFKRYTDSQLSIGTI